MTTNPVHQSVGVSTSSITLSCCMQSISSLTAGAIQALQLLKGIGAIEIGSKPEELFPNLFTGMGKLKGEYTIRLRKGAQPFALNTPWRVSQAVLLVDYVMQLCDWPADWPIRCRAEIMRSKMSRSVYVPRLPKGFREMFRNQHYQESIICLAVDEAHLIEK